MSKELDLKSATKPAAPSRPHMVRMREDVQFFGINGKQLTQGQCGIVMDWRSDVAGGVIVVTSPDAFPGESRWLFGGGIQHVSWKE